MSKIFYVPLFVFKKFCESNKQINFQIDFSTLTEKIVAALPKMKCPYLIEPHQIQGLDFINIFPVIQWLVKRSVNIVNESDVHCTFFIAFIDLFHLSHFFRLKIVLKKQQN